MLVRDSTLPVVRLLPGEARFLLGEREVRRLRQKKDERPTSSNLSPVSRNSAITLWRKVAQIISARILFYRSRFRRIATHRPPLRAVIHAFSSAP